MYTHSNAIGIIPARLKSTRFPNKLFAKINGVSILERVIRNVQNADIMDHIVVATDSPEIVNFCKSINVEYFFMFENVSCGSERSYYVWKKYPNYDWYVSFPADEPMLDPQELKKMWEKHLNKNYKPDEYITTCFSKFNDPSRIRLTRTCKIVSNKDNVIYFSRSPIPYSKMGLLSPEEYKQHIGIFIFNPKVFSLMNENKENFFISELSQKESLEQIAFIEHGLKVKLIEIKHKFHGVDLEVDIKSIEEKI